MNVLDRLIAWVSPRSAVERARNRLALKHYEAADKGRRLSGRARVGGDANWAMRGKQTASAEAARDLVRNNAWAAKGLACIVNNTVGYGITSEPSHPNKARAKRLREAFRKWAGSRGAHAAGQLDWFGIQALALRGVVESGAVLVVEVGDASGMSLRVLEREFLDTSKGTQGIEYDSRGRPSGYWIYDAHPGDPDARATIASTRYSADRVAHVYRIDRPGQRDGITWFAPVVLELHDLDGYEDAVLLRAKMAACKVDYVIAPESITQGWTVSDRQEPGATEIVPYGTEIKSTPAPDSGDYVPFTKQRLRRTAAGLGISYEAFTGDLSEVNYSSGRMGWQEFQRNIDGWLWQMLIPMLIDRVSAWFLDYAVMGGILTRQEAAGVTWQHNPPRRAVVDPAKEYPAIRDAIRSGLMTLPEALRDMGKTFDVQMAEHAEANKELDRLGVIVESDARRGMNAGNAPASEPALPAGSAANEA